MIFRRFFHALTSQHAQRFCPAKSGQHSAKGVPFASICRAWKKMCDDGVLQRWKSQRCLWADSRAILFAGSSRTPFDLFGCARFCLNWKLVAFAGDRFLADRDPRPFGKKAPMLSCSWHNDLKKLYRTNWNYIESIETSMSRLSVLMIAALSLDLWLGLSCVGALRSIHLPLLTSRRI